MYYIFPENILSQVFYLNCVLYSEYLFRTNYLDIESKREEFTYV